MGPATAAFAALALGLTSRGDIIVLAAVLAAATAARLRAIAGAMACTAVLVRWGSSSLGAIAGAQAVLGPAGWTGDAAGIASAWLAALALLACVPAWPSGGGNGRAPMIVVVFASAPFAIAAADVTVGPAPGGALLARLVGSVVAVAIAVVVCRSSADRRGDRARSVAAVVMGAVAILLAGAAG